MSLASSLAETKDARQLIHAGVVVPTAISRLYALRPGTPADRVRTLRSAFLATLRDREELEHLIEDLFKLDPAVAANLKSILG
jgi:hypothetical protein